MADLTPYPGRPRWLKVAAVIALVLVVVVFGLLLLVGGGHGPGRHLSDVQPDDQLFAARSHGSVTFVATDHR
jgi:hypothetical protein